MSPVKDGGVAETPESLTETRLTAAMREADRAFESDAANDDGSRQAWIEATALECQSCAWCTALPCDGCMAGGICDQWCHCAEDEDYGPQSRDDFDAEGEMR